MNKDNSKVFGNNAINQEKALIKPLNQNKTKIDNGTRYDGLDSDSSPSSFSYSIRHENEFCNFYSQSGWSDIFKDI